MRAIRPGIPTRLAAAFLMALPLVPACLVLGPVLGTLAVLGFHGWVFFIWDHMRLLRQRELAAGLRLAMGAGMPLDGALVPARANRGAWGWIETAALWAFPFPLYWPLWEQRFGYESLKARARELLAGGHGTEVLAMPGLLARDDLFDLRVAGRTKALDSAGNDDDSLSPRLLALVPSLAYPLVVMLMVVMITLFWSIIVSPRVERIFTEFGVPLPWLTVMVLEWTRALMSLLLPALALVSVALVMAYHETPLRWWMPGLRGVFAPHGRGMILEALGRMLATGLTIDAGATWLIEGGATDGSGSRMLKRLLTAAEQGAPPPEALARAGLVNHGEAAWLGTTIASGRFPAALGELGQSLQALALRRLHRRVTFVGTSGTVLVGIIVGTAVLAIFIPLIDLIGWLTP